MATLFLLAGIVLLYFSYRMYTKSQQWFRLSIATTGTVLQLISQKSTQSNGVSEFSYYPVMQFEAEGKTVQFSSSISVNPNVYKVGTTQNVWYNPQDPQDAKVNATASKWLIPVVLGSFGLVSIVIALIQY